MGLTKIKESVSSFLSSLEGDELVSAINEIRQSIHERSPFSSEPVDYVKWVKNDLVISNDYNPNSVAPPEMKLLEHSILKDGYTQPIVSWERKGEIEVVDGFHRHRVGKESKDVNERVHGYLPVVGIKNTRTSREDRMAATVRHNRARGKHGVGSMSEMVVELKRRNWSDNKIAKELGMDQDEVLRLCQITGMVEVFTDESFSQAWEAGIFEDDFEGIDDEL